MSDRRIHVRAGAPTLREEGGGPVLSGHAAVFDVETVLFSGATCEYREIVRRGAFAKVLAAAPNVVANFNHSDDHVLGRTTAGTLRLAEDSVGLRFEADVPDTTAGRDVLTLVRRGDLDGCSFAFVPADERTTITRMGDGRDLIVCEILEVSPLVDISVVTWPAYPKTDVSARAGAIVKEHRRKARDLWVSGRRSKLEAIRARIVK